MLTNVLKKSGRVLGLLVPLLLALFLLFGTEACTGAGTLAETKSQGQTQSGQTDGETSDSDTDAQIDEDGVYTAKDEVAAYIHAFGHLPANYISKKTAQQLGWDPSRGNLWDVAPGTSIGGDHFGNYEGQLPEKKGRKYTECDIDYDGGHRGAKRIIFSNDGLIFYTEDHYKTFTQLY